MKNNSRFTLLIFLIFSGIDLNAQGLHQPFVITNQKDTIWGTTGSAEYDKENQIFSFFDDTDSLIQFSPPQLSLFSFEGRLFKNITYSTDGIHIQNLYEAIVTSEDISLFYKSKTKKISTFLIESNNEVTVLTPPDGSKKWNSPTDEFIQQLNTILVNCPDFEITLNSTTYTAKSLKRTIVSYLDCQSIDYDFLRNEFKLKVNIGPSLGYSSSEVEFSGSNDDYEKLTDTQLNSSRDPYVGIFMELHPQVGQKHWSLFNELGFFAANYKNNSADDFLNLSFLELNHTIRFRSNSGGAEIYLEAGGGHQYILRQESSLISPMEQAEGFRKLSRNLLIGIGIKRGLFSVGFQYKKGGDFTKAERFNSKSQAMRFIFRIDFF